MILATDLDGTFLGGTAEQKKQLYSYIKSNSDITLIFVTGRGLASVVPLFDDPDMPVPDYIIADVGGTVVHGTSLQPVTSLQDPIVSKWPGTEAVRELVEGIDGLTYQDVPQQHRASFFAKDERLIDEVRKRVSTLPVDVIYSAGKFLDVLPAGVHKGSTLTTLMEYLQGDKSDVLVAGDTLNDLAMYTVGFKGVVVGNAEPRLLEATKGMPNVYFAKEPGAGGIMEAMTAKR